ncbi:uncharacterized protein LOC129111903 isoform X2 [Anoplopoma fimbria]|uniref:uncharacterized protein LOC129111903 isoform X2 n=1 Tax=Anoplopoma fimbria TaxID=229290 RepID=UPI0023ED822E|nr:uncharacterized protein LOC129111903 isoform X2 [Anoplopoma fimbria]
MHTDDDVPTGPTTTWFPSRFQSFTEMVTRATAWSPTPAAPPLEVVSLVKRATTWSPPLPPTTEDFTHRVGTDIDPASAALYGVIIFLLLLCIVVVLWWCLRRKGSYDTNEMDDYENVEMNDQEESAGSDVALRSREPTKEDV